MSCKICGTGRGKTCFYTADNHAENRGFTEIAAAYRAQRQDRSGTDASTELDIGDTLIYSETQGVRAVEIFFENQGGGPGEPVRQFIYIKDENISEKIQAELPEISVVFKSLINDTTQTPKVSFPVLSK